MIGLRLMKAALWVGASAALVIAMGGCRGDRSDKPPRQFFPDMDQQPRFNPQTETKFFANKRTMREPVDGVVAFGRSATVIDAAWNDTYLHDRDELLKDDDRVYLGVEGDGTYVARMPVEVTEALLDRGQNRFNIYCSVCHGYAAEGASANTGGMVGRRWSYPVPALTQDVYRQGGDKGQDGYIFNVIRNGVWGPDGANKMPSYRHALSEDDAWAVVAYVRALQDAASAKIEDVPAGMRGELEATRNAPPTSGDAQAADGAGEEGGS